MGRGLRVATTVVVVVAGALPALATEFASCWVTREFDPFYSEYQTITRCRIVGAPDTVDYGSESEVPATLYPNLGTDDNGQCWYLTSAVTPYVFLTRYGDGSADIVYHPDPSVPDDAVMIAPGLRGCTSEPEPEEPPPDPYSYAMDYIHDPPTPEFNPEPGEGVTGLATYIGVSVPDDHEASLTGGGATIEVQIVVDAVLVNWGDGETTTFPPDEEILAGYPDGSATHTYEVKNPDGVPVTVEYDWTARWRVSSGSWIALSVPNTSTTIDYPVAEVVSHLGD